MTAVAEKALRRGVIVRPGDLELGVGEGWGKGRVEEVRGRGEREGREEGIVEVVPRALMFMTASCVS